MVGGARGRCFSCFTCSQCRVKKTAQAARPISQTGQFAAAAAVGGQGRAQQAIGQGQLAEKHGRQARGRPGVGPDPGRRGGRRRGR